MASGRDLSAETQSKMPDIFIGTLEVEVLESIDRCDCTRSLGWVTDRLTAPTTSSPHMLVWEQIVPFAGFLLRAARP